MWLTYLLSLSCRIHEFNYFWNFSGPVVKSQKLQSLESKKVSKPGNNVYSKGSGRRILINVDSSSKKGNHSTSVPGMYFYFCCVITIFNLCLLCKFVCNIEIQGSSPKMLNCYPSCENFLGSRSNDKASIETWECPLGL